MNSKGMFVVCCFVVMMLFRGGMSQDVSSVTSTKKLNRGLSQVIEFSVQEVDPISVKRSVNIQFQESEVPVVLGKR